MIERGLGAVKNNRSVLRSARYTPSEGAGEHRSVRANFHC